MSDPQIRPVLSARPRYDSIDIARGIALIGVMVFHLCWDLRYYEFVLWPMDTDLGWIAFQKSLLSAFVGLSGISLWLAHGTRINWRPFWRRFVVLVGAALVITIATWVSFRPAFVYFGVLHALALFALLGLVFLRVPSLPLLLAGAAVIAFGVGFHDAAFNAKPLSWLGFWQVPPLTNDLVPIFPWFGVFLIGMALGRLLSLPAPKAWLAAPVRWGPMGGALKWIGRHTLILYLVHQPLLLGVIVPLDTFVNPHENWHRAERFMGECQPSCELDADDPGYCARYCACSFEQIEDNDLWSAIEAIAPTPEQSRAIKQMVDLCVAMGQAGRR